MTIYKGADAAFADLRIANAFSLNMLMSSEEQVTTVRVTELCDDHLFRMLNEVESNGMAVGSIVGHADTATLLTEILGLPVEVNRLSVELPVGSMTLVCQYNGPRLPEGASVLPDGAKFRFFLVEPTEAKTTDFKERARIATVRESMAEDDHNRTARGERLR